MILQMKRKLSGEKVLLSLPRKPYAEWSTGAKAFADGAARLAGGWLLGQARLFGCCAPLGLGFLGASGGGVSGVCAALGVILGAVTVGGVDYGVKYAAICLLIYVSAFLFGRFRVYETKWFMPLMCAVMSACVGLVYLRHGGLSLLRVTGFLAETLLAAFSCVIYAESLRFRSRRSGEKGWISLAALVMSLVLGLGRFSIAGAVNPGQCLAAFAVMACAYTGGAPLGGLMGLSLGLALDAVAQSPGVCTLCFGVSGAFGGLYRKKGRLPLAVCCVLANALAAFWAAEAAERRCLLYACFIASVLFMLPSERFFQNLRPRERAPVKGAASELSYLVERASLAADAFRQLQDMLRSTREAGKNDEDIMSVFDVAAERVCCRCQNRDSCWGRDYQDTRDALLNAVSAIDARGRAEPEDFPQHFRDRCRDVRGYTEAVSREMKALYLRRQMKSRLKADRDLLYRQYGDFAQVLQSLSAGGILPGREERRLERLLDEFLSESAPGTECGVFRDGNGRLHVDIQGTQLHVLQEREGWLEEVSGVLGVPLCMQEEQEHCLRLLEEEPFCAQLGVASAGRGGKEPSGDVTRSFKTAEGYLFLIVADGMGSGAAAAEDGRGAAELAEKLLRCGVRPETVMRLLNDALLLKSEKSMSCAGIDLMRVNLFTGETLVCKYGAAPSYIRSGTQVQVVRGKSQAAGAGPWQPDCTRLYMRAGSAAVIVSDGADRCEGIGEALLHYEGGSLKELACSILTNAAARAGWEDDMTVLALKLEKHGREGISGEEGGKITI